MMKHKILRYISLHRLPLSITLACLLLIGSGVGAIIYRTSQRVAHEGQTVVDTPNPQKQTSLKQNDVSTLTPAQAVVPSSVPAGAAQDCTQNSSGKLVIVSIAQQHLWACDSSAEVNESPVTTGASGIKNVDDSTPTGTWHVLNKQTNVDLKGRDANGSWDDHVKYWIPFIGNLYGFHDASWQTMPFGDQGYTTQGSHGCVHLPTAFIAWLYSWVQIGTTVTING